MNAWTNPQYKTIFGFKGITGGLGRLKTVRMSLYKMLDDERTIGRTDGYGRKINSF